MNAFIRLDYNIGRPSLIEVAGRFNIYTTLLYDTIASGLAFSVDFVAFANSSLLKSYQLTRFEISRYANLNWTLKSSSISSSSQVSSQS